MVIMKFPIVQLWPEIPVISAYNPIEIECIIQRNKKLFHHLS